MRLVYLLLGCLLFGLCSMAHSLPNSTASAQEGVSVTEDPLVTPLTEAEFEAVKKHLADAAVVEGKRPKPDKPDRRDRHKHDDVTPAPLPDNVRPEPIPPRPRPDPHFHDVKPLPPHIRPVVPVPDIHVPIPNNGGLFGWIRAVIWKLIGYAVAIAVVLIVIGVLIGRMFFGPRR